MLHMKFLEELAAMRRFGMRPGLDAIRSACTALGNPHKNLKVVHVAGTNGKGAVCAMMDAALRSAGFRVGRYTSPHLVQLNERFFLDGSPISDEVLESAAARVERQAASGQMTFFEALTAVAFLVYSEANVDYAVFETGLGGRLDATNICDSVVSVITRIGLDHCDWLGDTVEKIAAEKAGIIRTGVPVVLGANSDEARAVVEARAKALDAPFFYAPDIADESELPGGFSLSGAFNRENAVAAIAALKLMAGGEPAKHVALQPRFVNGFSSVVWPGRFQIVGEFVVDGAHNPPAAKALSEALKSFEPSGGSTFDFIAGFCGDKDVDEVLSVLAPHARKGYAVKTNNPRSLGAEETAAKMREAGIDAVACSSLKAAIDACKSNLPAGGPCVRAVICGSLFLAGEALVELGAYPWRTDRFDPSELLKTAR